MSRSPFHTQIPAGIWKHLLVEGICEQDPDHMQIQPALSLNAVTQCGCLAKEGKLCLDLDDLGSPSLTKTDRKRK